MTKSSGKTKRKWLFAAAFLAIVWGGVAYYFHLKREVITTVQTDRVTRRNLTELVVANGRIHPVVQVKISPEVSGEIIELPVKEGQCVKKGELLLRIKPDFYQASRRSAEASYQASVANRELAAASLRKAEIEDRRNLELFNARLISDSAYQEMKTAREVAHATDQAAKHQVNVAKAALSRAEEELAKTIISSPINGTVSKLNSQLGERVVGTAMMTGTEVMVVSDLDTMEARVDIGEVDVVLIAIGQKARLEVEAFRDRKLNGTVTEIANSSRNLGQNSGTPGGGMGGGQQQQEATRFEVKIRVLDKELFRPGMSVTAEVETRSRTNVLSVPIQSVTTRLPKGRTNQVATTNSNPRRPGENAKPIEVVFLAERDVARTAPVKRGISDDDYTEILEGLSEGQEIVSGGYKAISRDLEEGKRIKRGDPAPEEEKEKEKR